MGNKLSIPLEDFKPRELEIITMMAEGLSNKEIADKLFITTGTLRWYNKQIYSKLGTSRRTEVIALAQQMNLIGTGDSESAFNNVPIASGTLWGRDEELRQLTSQLDDAKTRLISLVASGGMGKTRLATELVHQITDNFTDGVYFIDLAPLRDAENIIPLMIELFGLNPSHKTPMQPILDFCRDKSLLLIFDNFETVLAGSQYLVEILETAPQVKIIVTSRERLDHTYETVFRLKPLEQDAEQLFIEMAQRRVTEFEVTAENEPYITEVCELVEGLPLAIILAAAWVDVLAVAEIVEEIKQNLDFLEDELATLPHRQRSIRAVLEQTWRRLTPPEQQSFMRLAVFRGGFNRRSAHGVADTDIHTLQTLLGKSLIQPKIAGRFDTHALIREFAEEKLTSDDNSDKTYNKHIQFFREYINLHAPNFIGKLHLAATQSIRVEYDNIIAALDYALTSANSEVIVSFAISSYEPLFHISEFEAFIRYAEQGLIYAQEPLDKILILQDLVGAYGGIREVAKAQNAGEQALKLIQQSAVKDERVLLAQADTERNLGHIFSFNQDIDIAHTYLFSAKDIYSRFNRDNGLLMVYTDLGVMAIDSGDYQLAEEHLSQALAIAKTLESDIRLIEAYEGLGYLYDSMGNLDKARDIHEQSLSIAQRLNNKERNSIALNNLGWNTEFRQDYEAAFEYYQHAAEINSYLGNRYMESGIAINMGFVALHFAEDNRAYDSFIKGISLSMTLGLSVFVLEALVGVAQLAYLDQEYAYSALLVEFINSHDALNPDIETRLQGAKLDFEAVLTSQELEAVQQEAAQLDLDTLIQQFIGNYESSIV